MVYGSWVRVNRPEVVVVLKRMPVIPTDREESLNSTVVFSEKPNIISYSVLQKDVISTPIRPAQGLAPIGIPQATTPRS